MNLAIVSEGTLANITLTPTLRDQIIAAQKNDVGMDKIRQRLSEDDPQVQCFHRDSEGVLWFKDRLVVPKNFELRKKFLMRLIFPDIPFTRAAIKCIKI